MLFMLSKFGALYNKLLYQFRNKGIQMHIKYVYIFIISIFA